MSEIRIHHHLETIRPVRAAGGVARIGGWCFEQGETAPTRVRLCVNGTVFGTFERIPRPDVAVRHARIQPIKDSGFKFVASLPAGVHEARLEALESRGVWRTLCDFLICSEDPALSPKPSVPTSQLVRLPKHAEHKVEYLAAGETPPLNILFVIPGDFASNHALHAISITRHLAHAGHRCIVVSEPPIGTLEAHGVVPFGALTLLEARKCMPVFPDGRGPDVIHAWTPRDNVRKTCEPLLEASGAILVVHLEDNEWQILSRTLNRTIEELRNLTPAEADAILPWNLSHPGVAERFMARASCATMVVDRLAELLPKKVPVLTMWPSANSRFFFPRPKPDALRQVLGFSPDHTVLFYHGNVHAANVGEMRALYEAIALLNKDSVPTTLIRTGENHCHFPGDLASSVEGCVIELGKIKRHSTIADLMAMADMFVQPGEPGPFNDYRFPSKLPEFFSIGRPVILPRTNLGIAVVHGRDAFVLERGDADGIAEAVRSIRSNPQLAERLADGAIAFAKAHFSWARNAERLADFYHETLARSRAR